MTLTMNGHRAPQRGPVASLRRLVIRPRIGLVVIGLVILGIVAWSIVGQLRTVEAEQTTAVQAEQLDTLADPLAALCASDATVRARLGDDVCFTAQQVVDAPPVVPAPALDGTAGMDGRGIVATVIRADGHLVVSYSDGARIDVGPVVGEAGVNGRGIVTSQITDGRLELVFTDGAVQDLGPVVGARGDAGANGTDGDDGRGITSTAIVEGRLIVTYSDATTEDAGPVPPGPPGADAELPAQVVRTYPDGTAETCNRNGGTEDAPVYDCSERV